MSATRHSSGYWLLATLMVLITLASVSWKAPTKQDRVRPAHSPLVLIGFFAVGLYVGFVQAGVGFLILALTSWAGLDLLRGNGVKVVSVGLLSVLALSIFITRDTVDWPMGLALGVGNMTGARIGVHVAVLKGHAWLRGVVMSTVVLFAVALWLE